MEVERKVVKVIKERVDDMAGTTSENGSRDANPTQ